MVGYSIGALLLLFAVSPLGWAHSSSTATSFPRGSKPSAMLPVIVFPQPDVAGSVTTWSG